MTLIEQMEELRNRVHALERTVGGEVGAFGSGFGAAKPDTTNDDPYQATRGRSIDESEQLGTTTDALELAVLCAIRRRAAPMSVVEITEDVNPYAGKMLSRNCIQAQVNKLVEASYVVVAGTTRSSTTGRMVTAYAANN